MTSSIQTILKTILGGRSCDPHTQIRTMNFSKLKGLAQVQTAIWQSWGPESKHSFLHTEHHIGSIFEITGDISSWQLNLPTQTGWEWYFGKD